MTTNKQQYESYIKKIDTIKKQFLKDTNFEIPEKLYIPCRNGDVRVHIITKVKGHAYFYIQDKKRYRTKDVNEIKDFVEKLPKMLKKNGIHIYYKEQLPKSTINGCHKEEDLDNKTIFRPKKEAEAKAALLLDIYGQKAGHINCEYCGKAVKEEEAVNYTIIYQGWNGYKKTVMEKTNKYCPGSCGPYNQMAHEG